MTNPSHSPMLLKYLEMFQDDPYSKVFAPLSECYRKIGQVDEAIAICKEGLEHNPDFIGGKVALARAYHDKKAYREIRELLKDAVAEVPDNLVAQKLYAEASLMQGYFEDALNAYKLLLYFNPNDFDAMAMIQELETAHYQRGGLIKDKATPANISRLMKLQKMLENLQKHQLTSTRSID